MSSQLNKLLVVEDDQGLQRQYRWSLDSYDVKFADDRHNAIDKIRRYEPPVVLLDLGLPPDEGGVSEGFATLTEILEFAPYTKIIVVTGRDDHENAVRSVGLGAYDFYQKPVEMNTLSLVLQRAYRIFNLERENRQLIQQEGFSPLAGVIAASDRMLEVSRRIEKVAPTDATVLLLGESGTGKELLAKAIHKMSPRVSKRFVPINCAAIPETLLESELFGYEKGAFTGAAKQTPGKVEYADSGTLFLDEIGDLSLALQAKLLRFLQERVIERIGGRVEIPIDVRIVCATHQDLHKLTENGEFRQDLYYRISAVTIRIPPLRDREDDVILLARYFLRRYSRDCGRPLKGFSEDAIRALESYSWRGNVRELENKIKGAVIMTDGARISARELGLKNAEEHPINFDLREVRKNTEHRAIERALIHAAGNISKASQLLGVSRPTLYDLLQKYHITLPE